MWLSRPVYELIPYAYMTLGVVLLVASGFATGSGASLLMIAGIAALIVGAVLWLKRRDYRRGQSEYNSRSLDD
jgi:LPXTG-motif cell wall-anchored protein